MGLDMYLSKKTFVKNWAPAGKDNYVITVTKNDVPVDKIKPERITYIEEEIGYWRKANQIHKWFVDNIQDGKDDCREYYVDESQLQELFVLCKQVLENKELASKLLPTQSGFFFGNTTYDEWYYSQLESTVKIIENLFSERNDDGYVNGDIYYQSSW